MIGDHIAFSVPHRDLMLLCGVGNEPALRRLLEVTRREFEASSRNISSEVYGASDGIAAPLTLPTAHPLASMLAGARLQFRGGEYNEQKDVLDPYLSNKGLDVFVATVSGLRLPSGEMISYFVWAEEVDSLLPITDVVVLAGGPENDGWHIKVGWADLIVTVGGALEVADLPGPIRYRTLRWPDETMLARLREFRAFE